MASFRSNFCVSVLLSWLCTTSATTTEDNRKVYIIYMGALPSDTAYSPMSHHQNILQEVAGSPGDSLVRNYGRSFNGFAARLTEAEREKLNGMEGVVSVFPSVKLELQTTRSWDFMGFGDNIKHKHEVESDIVVGVIDSGIWPESKSFADKGFGPPPKHWKGVCKGGSNFTCNNKVIGARSYGNETARDRTGHGTHTASTAAGNHVDRVSFYGIAQGTARGGVPSARIAVYKVCPSRNCDTETILAAFDDAIADGVDVITISIGGQPAPFENDTISIGAFHAMEKGVLTANSAGNNGPTYGSVGSVSPWILTVAASTTDRSFVTKVVLGNGKEVLGRSAINAFELNGTKFPFAYGKTTSRTCGEEEARSCSSRCLDDSVKGKILVCDTQIGPDEANSIGAVGLILQAEEARIPLSSLPQAILRSDDYMSLVSYINSTTNPEGTILKSEMVKDTDAPVVGFYSSRGPNTVIDDILKPDITAPGVNILAAFSPEAPVVTEVKDDRRVNYNLMSGTSMACPHVAGVAAYVKTLHPDWSPSAIKSAIMTTAWAMNSSRSAQDNEFAYGSGHLNPSKAADPGLVYEATREDYLKMLCAANYTAEKIKIISGENFSCSKGSNLKVRDLNYPSMHARIIAPSSAPKEITFSRTLTNVGTTNATYNAKVTTASGSKLRVKVKPDNIVFQKLGEKKSFTVEVSGFRLDTNFGVSLESASLVWSDGYHIVRSPIVIYFSNFA